MNKKKVGTALVVILLLAGLAWALVPRGPDPQVAKVLAMQEKVFNQKSPIPREDQREAFDELRKEAGKLTPDQRMKMMRDNPPPFVKEFQKNVRDYFELPEDKKQAALDKQIDAMEKMRKDMAKRFADNKGGPRGPGGFGGPPAPGGPGGGGPPGGGDRNEMRKRMLDNTSATDRAMFTEYFSAIQQRRQERGLPQMGPQF